jgi:hypothetical protein
VRIRGLNTQAGAACPPLCACAGRRRVGGRRERGWVGLPAATPVTPLGPLPRDSPETLTSPGASGVALNSRGWPVEAAGPSWCVNRPADRCLGGLPGADYAAGRLGRR